jgi:hypothetical protein
MTCNHFASIIKDSAINFPHLFSAKAMYYAMVMPPGTRQSRDVRTMLRLVQQGARA